jgi:AcrR family transcriptional regulator
MTLIATRRHERRLQISPHFRKGNIKTTSEGWVECAKVVLIEEGISAVKIDRMAKRLGVTRGGFYYHFTNHGALLEALLAHWKQNNRFVPDQVEASGAAEAVAALDSLTDLLVHERGFDSQYDMAVREWARLSKAVADVVKEVDETRILALRKIFLALGFQFNEADIRAKVFYFHQIGYYALGITEDLAGRERSAPMFVDAICGPAYQRAARVKSDNTRSTDVARTQRRARNT